MYFAESDIAVSPMLVESVSLFDSVSVVSAWLSSGSIIPSLLVQPLPARIAASKICIRRIVISPKGPFGSVGQVESRLSNDCFEDPNIRDRRRHDYRRRRISQKPVKSDGWNENRDPVRPGRADIHASPIDIVYNLELQGYSEGERHERTAQH